CFSLTWNCNSCLSSSIFSSAELSISCRDFILESVAISLFSVEYSVSISESFFQCHCSILNLSNSSCINFVFESTSVTKDCVFSVSLTWNCNSCLSSSIFSSAELSISCLSIRNVREYFISDEFSVVSESIILSASVISLQLNSFQSKWKRFRADFFSKSEVIFLIISSDVRNISILLDNVSFDLESDSIKARSIFSQIIWNMKCRSCIFYFISQTNPFGSLNCRKCIIYFIRTLPVSIISEIAAEVSSCIGFNVIANPA
ncbi:hypothetical protein L9F63_019199, partial [Diploptera punctata]